MERHSRKPARPRLDNNLPVYLSDPDVAWLADANRCPSVSFSETR